MLLLGTLTSLLHACGGGGGGGGAADPPSPVPPPVVPPPPPAASAPVWSGHAGNAQHTAQAAVATQALSRILWSMPIDLVPPYRAGGALLIHYGSPVITGAGTVLVPVKTSDAGDFRVEARLGASGGLIWQLASDYLLPPLSTTSWTPSCNLALDRNNRLYMPAAGGRLLIREQADSAGGTSRLFAFYGDSVYAANPSLRNEVWINTPLTLDDAGTLFFGFMANTGNPAGLVSGIARVGSDGTALWAGVAALAGDPGITRPAINCAPALSNDQGTLYIAVNNDAQTGYLLALDSRTLALKARQTLREPRTGGLARVADSSTSSPTVGPDGDVYYGVLDPVASAHNSRGWLLHFDATLATLKTPGSFGWDDTPSIVPTSMLPGYTGSAPYLLLCKYNNYYSSGTGNGRNQMALLDPHATQADHFVSSATPVTVMQEVQVITGSTPDPGTVGGVREWCVNTAVVDVATNSVLINNEDGYAYRWHLPSNTLSEWVYLNDGVSQAYTATVSGPTGIVYAVNNARLHALGRATA
jgi:hypothetical protein